MDDDRAEAAAAEAHSINAQVSVLMQQGIRHLAGGEPAAAKALACFDRALELRRRLPTDRFPLLRYDVAACWLNRAEALLQLRDGAAIAAAVAACDAAIGLLEALPLDRDPRFARRLAIAHQHRGLALQAQHGSSDAAAVAAFHAALAVLAREDASPVPDRTRLLGAIWIDVANAELSARTRPSRLRARAAAREALSVVTALERDHVDAAAVGLRARHVLCRVLADEELSAPGAAAVVDDSVHQATDLADEGLELIRHWERRGVTIFRAIAHDLFEFGARAYQRFRPHFRDEFIREWLGAHDGPPPVCSVGTSRPRS